MLYAENILICIAVPLAVTMLFTKGNARRMVASFLAGMLVCIISAYIAGVFSLSVTVHGLYNLLVSKPGVSSYIGYVMPMACAILLYMFTSGRNRYNERSSTKQSNGGILWQKK